MCYCEGPLNLGKEKPMTASTTRELLTSMCSLPEKTELDKTIRKQCTSKIVVQVGVGEAVILI